MDINEFVKSLPIADRTQKNVVYCCINKITFKAYVGYTTSRLSHRILSHHYSANHNTCNNFFHSSLLKNGFDSFDWYILFSSPDLERLKQQERYFIELFSLNKRENGYNLTNGGISPTLNLETRKKISSKAKKRNLYGENNPFFGKKHTEETKKHFSAIRKGKCNNPGYKHTDFTKEKLSQIRKELCKDPSVIAAMRSAQKSRLIICVSNGEVYCSINEASRRLNISKTGIKAQLHGRLKTYKGMEFRFID